jgi:hypothetical protein
VGREAFVRGFSDDVIVGMLGPNPTQERFRLAAYYLIDLAFQANGDESLGWGEFMERYTEMYPRGQPGLPNDPVMDYVNNLRTTGAAPGSSTTRGARTTRRHDPMRECNVCVASSSSSSEPEPAPRHRGTDAQRRARLDELADARRQFDEELALLHQELGVDVELCGQQPAQGVPVQEQPERGTVTDAPHRTFLCRGSPARGTATGASAVRLSISRTVVHLRRRHAGQRATTTDAPTKVQMSTPTLTLTPRHSSGECPTTSPLRPYCCAAARSLQPPRSDECASS